MEKFPQGEYRDNLANKLREIRNSDEKVSEIAKAKAQGYLDAKKETEEYQLSKKDKIETHDRIGEFVGLEHYEIDQKILEEHIKEGPLDLSALSNHDCYLSYDLVSSSQHYLLKQNLFLDSYVKYKRAQKLEDLIQRQASIENLKDLLTKSGGIITSAGFIDAEVLIKRIDEFWLSNKRFTGKDLPKQIESLLYREKNKIADDMAKRIDASDYVDLENPTNPLRFVNDDNIGHYIMVARRNKYINEMLEEFDFSEIMDIQKFPIQSFGEHYAIAVDTSDIQNRRYYKLSFSDVKLPNGQSLSEYIKEKEEQESRRNRPQPPSNSAGATLKL